MIFDFGLSATALALFGIFFGAIIGSFLNVVIFRLPIMLKAEWSNEAKLFLGLESNKEKSITIISPRSQCHDCGTTIKALHNIPLLSYCFLRGRCSHCDNLISIQYPIIELLTAFVTAYFFTVHGISEKTLLSLLSSYCLIVLATIDIREQILPDQITLPLLWIGLGVSLFFGLWATPEESILGAALGYLSLWSVMYLFKLITGKEGMGYGDFKLNAAIGAWIGWQLIPTVILISSFAGAVIGLLSIAFYGHDRRNPFAFGPFLCIAGWVSMEWGDQLAYLFSYLSF